MGSTKLWSTYGEEIYYSREDKSINQKKKKKKKKKEEFKHLGSQTVRKTEQRFRIQALEFMTQV